VEKQRGNHPEQGLPSQEKPHPETMKTRTPFDSPNF